MTYSDFKKELKVLRAKPFKLKKYMRFNAPKERTTGIAKHRCRRCGRFRGHISKYGLHYCRQCFREIATRLGFKKFN